MTDPTTDPRWYIAPSVSPEARAKLQTLRAMVANWIAQRKLPETLADFDAAAARGAAGAEMLGRATIDALGSELRELALNGVPALEVTPRDYQDDGTAVIYVHGGGFVQGSARANLLTAAHAADTSGRRIISIDYLLAPRGTWKTILEQIVSAWTVLLETRPATTLGLMGDSAGGCIAAAGTLLLRERGLPLPAALTLLSPCTDLAGEGDTNLTLAPIDYLDRQTSTVNRNAYAPGADLTDPLVSPVHGDFAKGYPPTLIQVGTRELLLSDSVRLHRALRAAGQASRLEVYEGMPHVFQPLLADAPEGREAWAEMAAFWSEHLRR